MRKVFSILLPPIIQLAFSLAAHGQISDIGLPQFDSTNLPQKDIYNENTNLDSLGFLVTHAKDDTIKIKALFTLADAYLQRMRGDSFVWYTQQALERSQSINYLRGAYEARVRLANIFNHTGNYARALELTYNNLHIAETLKDTIQIVWMNRQLSGIYSGIGDFPKQLEFARKVKALVHSGFFKKEKDIFFFSQFGYVNFMSSAFDGLNQLDSALNYRRRSYNNVLSLRDTGGLAVAGGGLVSIFLKLGYLDSAFLYAWKTIDYAKAAVRKDIICGMYLNLAQLYGRQDSSDSALYYAGKSLQVSQAIRAPARELEAASLLNSLYAKQGNTDSAYKYLSLAVTLKDSLFNEEKVKQVQDIQFSERQRQQQLEQARKESRQQYQTNLKVYGLSAGLFIVALIAFFLNRNSRQRKKANVLLQEKNQQIENTLADLKATQAQLIQSEKMASLGELTAGIAHEIQNPLNFVNNFAETNVELLEELEQELDNGNIGEAKAVAGDARENQKKILHHGKRAEGIVKSMLEHSRNSKGQKQLTDLNKLADEYLRLAYHGLRAKDKSFNAAIETHFDESIGKVNIVPQDLGRVLLNLFNNAFYAVSEKRKGAGESYEPTVTVSTKKLSNAVEISVKDNGTGIPQKVVDKVFQPFFTTKPTGQGTGLGLSLSYDIIKAHGGELKVESKEGEGAEFTISLPINA